MSPSRSTRLVALTAAATLGLLVLGGGVASAHVRASSTDATPGGYGEITFRVPNESDTASTTRLSVQLPTDTPFGYVGVEPVAGWDVSVEQAQLPEPITTDGTVTEAPSVVTWTATGAGIAPGEYQNFTILAGPMPGTDSVSLPTVQTYSDGTEAAWIEPTVEGQDEPQYPAPVLSLTAGAAAGSDAHGGSADDGTTSADEGSTDVAETASSTPAGTSGVAVAALVVGIAALLAAVAGLVIALRGRRSPTA